MSQKLHIVALLWMVLFLVVSCAGPETGTTAAPAGETAQPATTEAEEATQAPTTEATTLATEEAATEEAAANVPMSEIEETFIRTSGSHVVGIGDYVAAERYAVPAGEDPATQPTQAFILPYAV